MLSRFVRHVHSTRVAQRVVTGERGGSLALELGLGCRLARTEARQLVDVDGVDAVPQGFPTRGPRVFDGQVDELAVGVKAKGEIDELADNQLCYQVVQESRQAATHIGVAAGGAGDPVELRQHEALAKFARGIQTVRVAVTSA